MDRAPNDRQWHVHLTTLAGVAVLVFVSLFVYSPALRGGILWDDAAHFSGNPNMHGWRGLFEIWTSRSAFYFPLTLTTFWTLFQLFGTWTPPYHLVTLGMHIAGAILFWYLLMRLRVRGGWVAAMLFAIHPMQVESVEWLREMKNTQSCVFFLLSLLALERGGFLEAEDHVPRVRFWQIAAMVLFVAAILSKTSTVMLPAVIVVLVWWRGHLKGWASIDWTVPFFLIALLASGWTIWEQRHSSGASGFEWSGGPSYRLALAGHVAWFYPAKLVWPHPLIFVYPQWHIDTHTIRAWLPLIGGGLLLGTLWWMRQGIGRIGLAVTLLYLALVFPVLGLFNIYYMRYAFVADHFAYLATLPLFACVGAALSYAGRIRAPLCGVILAACCVAAWDHAHAFKSEEALWRDTLDKNKGAWMVHNSLGASLLNNGDLAGAVHHFEESLRYNPRHYEALSNYANLQMQQGHIDDAIMLYRRALELRPDFPLILYNLGIALDRKGDLPAAGEHFARALAYNPAFRPAQEQLALVYERRGMYTDAAQAFYLALGMRGMDVKTASEFLSNRAIELSAKGELEGAAEYRRAVERKKIRTND